MEKYKMLSKKEADDYIREIDKKGSILGLESIRELMKELEDVQDALKIIHVAGTNGKGSACAMLESVLIEAGYRVGKYTSPAVFTEAERYRVNGENITEEEFAKSISQVKAACERMLDKGLSQPTRFEVETAAAFLYFYQKKCDIVILETGMGGATDATNIIRKSLVSILTSISRDHMGFLGDTIEEIAAVKAGIIKKHGKVVAMCPESGVRKVIDAACEKQEAEVVYTNPEQVREVRITNHRLCFLHEELGEIKLKMMGKYQVQNALCVIEAVKQLEKQGYAISKKQLKQGLEKAEWEGRFSILNEQPLLVIDGAHNEDAAKKLRETLEMGFTKYKIIYIIGVLADKEHEKMLKQMLPLAEKVFTVTPHNPRAMDGKELAKEALKYHKDVTFVPEIKEAVDMAIKEAKEEQKMVLAFGSLSYLGEVKKALKEIKIHD